MNNLCFDCDDTLYDLSWPFRKAMERFFPEVTDENFDMEQMYQDYRGHGDALFDLLQEGTITTDDSGILRIVKLCRQYGLHIDVLDAWEFQKAYKDFQYQVEMSDQLYSYLERYPGDLAILTNGQTEHQHKKVHSLKADQIVPAGQIYASQELGYRKPDPRAFQEAFQRMGKDPKDWYYIGDSYENDMEGARNAGMKTIHFNRHHAQTGPAADYLVYTEEELISLLDQLNKDSVQ